jgi:hypothetical protein
LTTIAGNGMRTPVDDGGPATASALVRPVDVKVDGRGEIWIADAGAHRVYRLGADGLLRLVAGTGMPGIGQGGSLARWVPLNTPTGVEPDGAGGVVIADSGNGRLVHVDADGVLRVVVADGAGQPIRLMTTPDGEIAFTDGVTHRILQLSIRRTVSTRSVRIDFAPGVHGDVTGKLTLLTNDPAQPQWSIPYHGRGVSKWLDLSESEHDFGAVSGPTH